MQMAYGWWQQEAKDLAVLYPPDALSPSMKYLTIWRDGKRQLLHRWLWEQLVGPIPVDHQIDHKNGIRTDCQIGNLRCVPQLKNLRNRAKQSNNTSGTTGVSRVVIKGTEYWVCTWSDPVTHKKKMKYFNITKLTEAGAEAAAIAHRDGLMQDFITNHDYTARHGQ